jgi:acetoin utilization protein AcuC
MDQASRPPLFYHPRMLAYDFGPQHPLRPERLARAMELLGDTGWEATDPGPGDSAEPLLVHAADYVQAVRDISDGLRQGARGYGRYGYGFGSSDNPPFAGMYEAALAYSSGSARAAEAVRDGASRAITLAGGLHHARRAEASGFCIFNDCAIAIAILRQRFERVAYVDIDVHHGDGVQWIFYDDPTVMTCSIHQDPRTLYPGTGFADETGADYTAVNVPVAPGTGPEAWLEAFSGGILPPIERFRPEAIVLQMGTDSHRLDPLARVDNDEAAWLEAVRLVRDLGLPLVALGGGGYALEVVSTMWASAALLLAE